MSWVKRFFRKKRKKPPQFVIEFYPRTNKYTVKHKHGWFKTLNVTGAVMIGTYFPVIDFYETEEEARETIELYKEQTFKEGVTKIIIE